MDRIIDITPASAGGSSAAGWIFLIVFFGIIVALIIVAVIGSKKDRIEKLIENDKRRKLRETATSDRVALFSALNDVALKLEAELKDFKPSVGMKSLGDINREASDLIKSIHSSKMLKGIYKSDDFKNEIKPIVDELYKVKPSNWTKEAMFSLNLIHAKYKSLASKEENKEDIKRGLTLEWH